MGEFTVRLEPLGVEFSCRDDQTVMEAAEEHGILPLFGCRGGNCGSCKSQIISGSIDYDGDVPWALMEDEREAGMGLLCIGRPRENLVVEVDPALFSVRTTGLEKSQR